MGIVSIAWGFIGAAFLINIIAHLKIRNANREEERRKYGGHWAEGKSRKDTLHWSEKQALEQRRREEGRLSAMMTSLSLRRRW